MSNFKFAFPLTLIAAALLAAGCSGTNAPSAESGGVTSEPGAGAPPSSVVGYYVTLATANTPASTKETGTLNAIGDDLRSKLQTFNGGVNQNIIFDKSGAGTLFAVGLTVDAMGVPTGGSSLNTLINVTTRGSAPFSLAAGDKQATYAAITSAKGVTAIDSSVGTANRFVISDASGPNGLHLVNKSATGVSVPVLTFTTAQLGGNAWDAAYDSTTDTLYVALTAGTNAGSIAVYDGFAGLTASGAPTRLITPGRVQDLGAPGPSPEDISVKLSTNLHGIAYDKTSNTLIVSDVGVGASTSAGFDTDGSLYLIRRASTAANFAAVGPTGVPAYARALPNLECYAGYTRIVANDPANTTEPEDCIAATEIPTQRTVFIRGAATNLGNPVDLIVGNNGNDVLVAEKANGGGFSLLNFADLITSANSGSNGTVSSTDLDSPADGIQNDEKNNTLDAQPNVALVRKPVLYVYGSSSAGKLESITSATK